MFSNKRGETLIEIVVSFAILSLVMIGTTGLIADLVGMATESRTVTEATALAQKGMSVGLGKINTQCDLRLGSDFPAPVTDYAIYGETLTNGLKLEVRLRGLETAEENMGNALIAGNGFEKIVSTVMWTDKKEEDRTYKLSQVVHR